jgi:hypothetical protein
MVDEQDSEVELTLKFAQVAQERGDLFGCVFVATVQTDERVQDQECRIERRHGLTQLFSILRDVEQEPWCGDHVDGQSLKGSVGGSAYAFESLPNHDEGVLGGEQEHWSGAADREPAQAWSAGGDADGHVQSQEAFATLGFGAVGLDRSAHRHV